MKKIILLGFCFLATVFTRAEDGYRLWLRYVQVDNTTLLSQYRNAITGIQVPGNSPTLSVIREELITGLEGLLGKKITVQNNAAGKILLAGTAATLPADLLPSDKLKQAGKEGFVISTLS